MSAEKYLMHHFTIPFDKASYIKYIRPCLSLNMSKLINFKSLNWMPLTDANKKIHNTLDPTLQKKQKKQQPLTKCNIIQNIKILEFHFFKLTGCVNS